MCLSVASPRTATMPAPPLRHVRVARPCSADWSAMEGTDRARHCALCRLTVYNLSEMTADEARAFVEGAEGRTCVRFYRRADGTVLTRDCPGPRPAPPTRAQKALMVAALAGAFVASDAAVDAARDAFRQADAPPVAWSNDVVMGEMVWEGPVMGTVDVPPPPPPPAPPRTW